VCAISSAAQFGWCNFTRNSAGTSGGALHSAAGAVNVENSSFVLNTAVEGGAMGLVAGSFMIEKAHFSNNTATDGGALFASGCSPSRAVNARFTGNSGRGSAAFIRDCPPRFVNCLMADNQGIPLYHSGARPEFIHCTVAENRGTDFAMVNTGGSEPVIVNSVICSNPYYDRIARDRMRDFDVIQISNRSGSSADVSYSCVYQTDGAYSEYDNHNIIRVVEFVTDSYMMQFQWNESYEDAQGQVNEERISNPCPDKGTDELPEEYRDLIRGARSIVSLYDLTAGPADLPDPGYHQ
jgi:predicted outer membrane repeat protein